MYDEVRLSTWKLDLIESVRVYPSQHILLLSCKLSVVYKRGRTCFPLEQKSTPNMGIEGRLG